jgi:hypothetical protein
MWAGPPSGGGRERRSSRPRHASLNANAVGRVAADSGETRYNLAACGGDSRLSNLSLADPPSCLPFHSARGPARRCRWRPRFRRTIEMASGRGSTWLPSTVTGAGLVRRTAGPACRAIRRLRLAQAMTTCRCPTLGWRRPPRLALTSSRTSDMSP